MTTLLEQFRRTGFVFAVYMLGNADDAADAVQDGLSVAWQHQHTVRGADDPSAWFFRVLRNKCVDRLRDRTKRRHEALINPADTRSTNAVDRVSTEELSASLRRELAALEQMHREILLLRDVHGFSYARIAEVLSIAPGTVMSRLHRARLTLRDRLKDQL